MNELIKTQTTDDGNIAVSGRELHKFLEVNSNYTTWFDRMTDYGFSEGVDFKTWFPNLESETHGGQNKVDHVMTLEMAKEIAMIQRNEKGKQARQYFIKLEKAWNSPEQVMARALIMSDKKIKSLVAQIDEMKPKAIFADAVSVAKESILIRCLAGFLKQNGIDIGQNRLFAWMREHGYLVKGGNDKNMPTQKAMDLKLFEIKMGTYINGAGENVTTRTVKVTGKGQIYFVNKFLAEV